MILVQFIQHDTTEFQMKRTNEKEDEKKKRVQFTCLKFTVSEFAFFSPDDVWCIHNCIILFMKSSTNIFESFRFNLNI